MWDLSSLKIYLIIKKQLDCLKKLKAKNKLQKIKFNSKRSVLSTISINTEKWKSNHWFVFIEFYRNIDSENKKNYAEQDRKDILADLESREAYLEKQALKKIQTKE